jgi:hypothetical protein
MNNGNKASKQMYALTFKPNGCTYRVHVATCQASTETKTQLRIGTFNTAAEAMEWAHDDESEKTGREVIALAAICKCCK